MAAVNPQPPQQRLRGRRRWWLWLVIGAGALGALGLVLFLVSRRSSSTTTSPVVGPVDAGGGGSGLNSANTGAGPLTAPTTAAPSTTPAPPVTSGGVGAGCVGVDPIAGGFGGVRCLPHAPILSAQPPGPPGTVIVAGASSGWSLPIRRAS